MYVPSIYIPAYEIPCSVETMCTVNCYKLYIQKYQRMERSW